jgi:hypothetical protein
MTKKSDKQYLEWEEVFTLEHNLNTLEVLKMKIESLKQKILIADLNFKLDVQAKKYQLDKLMGQNGSAHASHASYRDELMKKYSISDKFIFGFNKETREIILTEKEKKKEETKDG